MQLYFFKYSCLASFNFARRRSKFAEILSDDDLEIDRKQCKIFPTAGHNFFFYRGILGRLLSQPTEHLFFMDVIKENKGKKRQPGKL